MGCYNEGKLLESSLLLTEASSVGLRPQVKRSPNTLLQRERQPSIYPTRPRALRITQEPPKSSCRSARKGWDKMIARGSPVGLTLPYSMLFMWYNVFNHSPTTK
jgi:hypothetical protein